MNSCAFSNVIGVVLLSRFLSNPDVPKKVSVPTGVLVAGMALVRQLLSWKAFVDNEAPTGDTRYFSPGKKGEKSSAS